MISQPKKGTHEEMQKCFCKLRQRGWHWLLILPACATFWRCWEFSSAWYSCPVVFLLEVKGAMWVKQHKQAKSFGSESLLSRAHFLQLSEGSSSYLVINRNHHGDYLLLRNSADQGTTALSCALAIMSASAALLQLLLHSINMRNGTIIATNAPDIHFN